VIVNPHSRANRLDPTLAMRFAETLGEVGEVVAAPSLERLDDEAGRLAQSPPSIIGIHGGDGTLHRVVAALIRRFGERPLPPIALLTGGTMNVVASSLGIRAEPLGLLSELAHDARADRPPQTVARRCLRVGDAHGFVFGNGFMANFLEEYYARPGYGASRAMWILARTFSSATVSGAYAQRVFRKFAGRVTVDGQPLPWRTLTGLSAATVREVGMGFKLNHRADEDPDRFSVLAIHAGALSLAVDLVPVHLGQGIAPARAWSAVAGKMLIEPDDGENLYTVDGDLYRSSGPLEVGIGPRLQFVRPRATSR
jgi:diacylglycerol kinase family enzyme